MSTASSISKLSDKAASAVDKAANSAKSGLDDAKDWVDDSSDKLGDKLRDAGNDAAPLFDKASRQARAIAGQGVDAASRAARQLSDGVTEFAEGAVAYTKKNPMTAVVVAAAAGAIVYGLVKALSSNRD